MILGLDLSLRAAGMCAIPLNWNLTSTLDWNECVTGTTGESLKRDSTEAQKIERLKKIRDDVLSFAVATKATVAVIEGYAFSKMTSQAHSLGEAGGVVKLALSEHGIPVYVMTASHARSCLGSFPRKDTKVHVSSLIKSLGCPENWSGDEIDAFVQANGWSVANGYGGIVIR